MWEPKSCYMWTSHFKALSLLQSLFLPVWKKLDVPELRALSIRRYLYSTSYPVHHQQNELTKKTVSQNFTTRSKDRCGFTSSGNTGKACDPKSFVHFPQNELVLESVFYSHWGKVGEELQLYHHRDRALNVFVEIWLQISSISNKDSWIMCIILKMN